MSAPKKEHTWLITCYLFSAMIQVSIAPKMGSILGLFFCYLSGAMLIRLAVQTLKEQS